MQGMYKVVVFRALRQEDHQNIRIIGDELDDSITQILEEPGNEICLFGGGSLFRSLLDWRLVDSVEVTVIPASHGAGKPLLTPRAQAKLEHIGSKVYKKTGCVIRIHCRKRGIIYKRLDGLRLPQGHYNKVAKVAKYSIIHYRYILSH
jgi:dihydrofolate reductase